MESLPESEPESEPVPEPEPVPSGVVVGLVPVLPVFSSLSVPFLESLAFTSLLSLTLSAGIVTLPVFSTTVTPSGVFPSIFHLLSPSFLTVNLVGLVFSPSGVYVISRPSVPVSYTHLTLPTN